MRVTKEHTASKGMALVLAMLSLAVWPLSGAVVRTLEGRSCRGEVRLEPGGLSVVQSPDGAVVTVVLTNLRAVEFDVAQAGFEGGGGWLEGWQSRDIGNVGVAGMAGQGDGVHHIRAAGLGPNGTADSLHYLYRGMGEGAEMTARFTQLKANDPQAAAGLMLREGLAPENRFAAILVRANGETSFARRKITGGEATLTAGERARLPVWLRLAWKGETFDGYFSDDGQTWRLAGRETQVITESSDRENRWRGKEFFNDGEVPGRAWIGFFSASHNNFELCSTAADGLGLTVNGLKGDYFGDKEFQDLKLTRIDPKIFFGWGLGSPDPALDKDNFSVRWTGHVVPPTSEDYQFYFDADDAAQLWVEGRLLPNVSFRKPERSAVEDRQSQLKDGRPAKSAALPLKVGQKYHLKFEYQEGLGSASVRLGWSSPSRGRELIPSSCLFYTFETNSSASTMRKATPAPASRLGKGLILADGSFLPGEVSAADDTTIKFLLKGRREYSLVTRRVCRMILHPASHDLASLEGPRRRGVVLPTGDFLEGELVAFDGRWLKISSVLFGLRTYNVAAKEVSAVVLGEPLPPARGHQVRTADGSILMARNLMLAAGEARVENEALGELKLPQSELLEIRWVESPGPAGGKSGNP